MEELNFQRAEYSEHGTCMLRCRNITPEELHLLMKVGKVNYDESDVHAKPFATYAIETTTVKGKKLRVFVTDIDTVTQITSVLDLSLTKDTCKCK